MGRGIGIKYCGAGANQREAEMLGCQIYYGGRRASRTRENIVGQQRNLEGFDKDGSGYRR